MLGRYLLMQGRWDTARLGGRYFIHFTSRLLHDSLLNGWPMIAGSRYRGRQAGDGEPTRSTVEPPILRVTLLGGFRVAAGETVLLERDWHSRLASQLVKLLALAPEHALHREQLGDRLWPEFAPAAATNNLRHTLYLARRALSRLPVDPAQVLQTQNGLVQLYPTARLRIDVDDFAAAAEAARHAADPAAYWAAIERYTGPLLPKDLYADWAAARRETLTATYLALLDDVAQLHEVRGEYPEAVAALRRLVAAEPVHEAATVRLMQLYAVTRRRPLALRQYQQLARNLARELDATPEPATRALYEEIRQGHFPSAATNTGGDRFPTAAAARPLTNLPHLLTNFIGREREIAEIGGVLTSQRLVTLIGPGGTGKTRLALELARIQADDFPDGVWLVELAALVDPTLVPQAVADVLGIQAEGRAQVETLVTALRDSALLLVLDNCEHLIGACAQLVDTLLSACPRVRILATSREALRLPGERPWPVPALPLPDRDDELAVVVENEAVRLFVDRVRWHQSGFALTAENADAVCVICRRLDGLPLALELAAARTAILTPPQLASRLDDALGVLTNGSRDAPTRHQTLRATLNWSYALLDAREQRLFRRLAVFAGGWTLEAAEAIGPGDDLAQDEIVVLLGQLVAKSLVQVDLSEEASRYRLLEPVRQYSTDLLAASGETDAVRARHAAHFVAFVERIEPELTGPRQVVWFDRLDREHDNLRAALAWALERENAETILRLGAVCWRYWGLRWHSAEGLKWLRAGLALASATPSSARARAALGAGELARRLLDFELARSLLQEALDLHRALGDTGGVAWSLIYLANALSMAGVDAEGRVCAQESLTLFRTLGDQVGMARALNTLGEDARLVGDYAQAAACYMEALDINRTMGDQQEIAKCLHNLGYVALHHGDVPRAVRSFHESYRLNQELGYRTGPLSFLEGMAASASAAGHPEAAARLYGAWTAGCAPPGTEFKLHPPDQAEYDRAVARVRAALDEAAFARTWAAGAKLTLEQALTTALRLAETLAHVPASAGTDLPAVAARLTPRELEVARLMTLGLTNHQIAQTLGLAERTIDTHVGHVLHKLGVSTRQQVAAQLAEADRGSIAR